MKNYFSLKRVGVFALLFPMLFLPLLHLHPAYEHGQGAAAEGHQHQPAVHADFLPYATHGHEHQEDHDQHDRDLGVSIDPSHHALSQIDLPSFHIGQSFQSTSVFKRNLVALDQDLSNLSVFSHFQRGTLIQQDIPPRQTIQFSPPSLRAPPYSA